MSTSAVSGCVLSTILDFSDSPSLERHDSATRMHTLDSDQELVMKSLPEFHGRALRTCRSPSCTTRHHAARSSIPHSRSLDCQTSLPTPPKLFSFSPICGTHTSSTDSLEPLSPPSHFQSQPPPQQLTALVVPTVQIVPSGQIHLPVKDPVAPVSPRVVVSSLTPRLFQPPQPPPQPIPQRVYQTHHLRSHPQTSAPGTPQGSPRRAPPPPLQLPDVPALPARPLPGTISPRCITHTCAGEAPSSVEPTSPPKPLTRFPFAIASAAGVAPGSGSPLGPNALPVTRLHHHAFSQQDVRSGPLGGCDPDCGCASPLTVGPSSGTVVRPPPIVIPPLNLDRTPPQPIPVRRLPPAAHHASLLGTAAMMSRGPVSPSISGAQPALRPSASPPSPPLLPLRALVAQPLPPRPPTPIRQTGPARSPPLRSNSGADQPASGATTCSQPTGCCCCRQPPPHACRSSSSSSSSSSCSGEEPPDSDRPACRTPVSTPVSVSPVFSTNASMRLSPCPTPPQSPPSPPPLPPPPPPPPHPQVAGRLCFSPPMRPTLMPPIVVGSGLSPPQGLSLAWGTAGAMADRSFPQQATSAEIQRMIRLEAIIYSLTDEVKKAQNEIMTLRGQLDSMLSEKRGNARHLQHLDVSLPHLLPHLGTEEKPDHLPVLRGALPDPGDFTRLDTDVRDPFRCASPPLDPGAYIALMRLEPHGPFPVLFLHPAHTLHPVYSIDPIYTFDTLHTKLAGSPRRAASPATWSRRGGRGDLSYEQGVLLGFAADALSVLCVQPLFDCLRLCLSPSTHPILPFRVADLLFFCL
ncbi:hypothetical protein PAPYR_5744 [Paratrimastix pyriformis]|uniref:Uncharacterized protein n=1 Tax=Paratrimastix pyriformis TaxID=342808 RepID=A0ABQ8UH20_9EUKA|nr:hypothetical protein PAPYR_5744 [Paratrimastix pyriformis]